MHNCVKQAYLDGQMAALAKHHATDNPHPLNTCHSRAWGQGYRYVIGDVQAPRKAMA